MLKTTLLALIALSSAICASADVSKMQTFSHESGFVFEAPQQWVSPDGTDAMLFGIGKSYIAAGQEEGFAQEFAATTGNVLTLYSSEDVENASAALFVTYMDIPGGERLTQETMKNLSEPELDEFVTLARSSATQSIDDMNLSLKGLGTIAIDDLYLIDQHGSLCLQQRTTSEWADGSTSQGVTVTCPVGSHFFRWEISLESFGSDRDYNDVEHILESFRITKQLGAPERQ